MPARVVLVWLACCALWGSTWIVIRVGLEDLPPLLFAGLRMCVAGLLLAPWGIGWPARRASGRVREPWGWIAAVGIVQLAIPYGLMFVGQQWIPSGLAAVLFATFPVWVAVFAAAALPGERLGPGRAAAALLGFAGIAVLKSRALGEAASPHAILGGLLVVIAAGSCAAANVIVKRRGAGVAPARLTAIQSLAAGPALLLASAALEHGRAVALTPRAAGAVLYLAVFATVLTYLGLYWLMPRVPISFVASIPLVDTTIAVLLGAAVLGEPLGWHVALGGAMVLAAAWLAGRQPASAARGAGAAAG